MEVGEDEDALVVEVGGVGSSFNNANFFLRTAFFFLRAEPLPLVRLFFPMRAFILARAAETSITAGSTEGVLLLNTLGIGMVSAMARAPSSTSCAVGAGVGVDAVFVSPVNEDMAIALLSVDRR